MAEENSKRKPVKAILAIVIILALAGGGLGAFFIVRNSRGADTRDLVQFGGMEWRVLEEKDGMTLLLSEYIVKYRTYHGEEKDKEKEEKDEKEEKLEITWETSDIRRWLNKEFLNRFSAEEKARIAATWVVNHDNPWFSTPGGKSTMDKVFLLSLEEVVRYFGDSGQLAKRPNENTWSISDLFSYDKERVAYEVITPKWKWMRTKAPKQW